MMMKKMKKKIKMKIKKKNKKLTCQGKVTNLKGDSMTTAAAAAAS